MSKYRNALPQMSGGLFLTDGGLETTLIFHDGIDLPLFASFDLLKSERGTAVIRDYYERYIAIAKLNGTGFVLEGATWRASPDWAEKLGYSRAQLAEANRAAVKLMVELRDKHESPQTPMVISANIGPRGDGYKIDNAMNAAEAEDLSRLAGERVPRYRGGSRQRLHDQLCRGRHRRCARVQARRHAVGDFIHGRDRRKAA